MKTTKFEVLIDALKEKFAKVLNGGYLDDNFYKRSLCEAIVKNKDCSDYLEVYNYMQIVCADITVTRIKALKSVSEEGFESEVSISTEVTDTHEKITIVLDASFDINTLTPRDILLCITIAMSEVVYAAILSKRAESKTADNDLDKESITIPLNFTEDDVLAVKELVAEFQDRVRDSKVCVDITIMLPSGTKFTINLYDPMKGLE